MFPLFIYFYLDVDSFSFQRTLKHLVPILDLPVIVIQILPVPRPRQTLVEILLWPETLRKQRRNPPTATRVTTERKPKLNPRKLLLLLLVLRMDRRNPNPNPNPNPSLKPNLKPVRVRTTTPWMWMWLWVRIIKPDPSQNPRNPNPRPLLRLPVLQANHQNRPPPSRSRRMVMMM